MQHKGTVLIEADRLILRKFRIEDGSAAFYNWTNDGTLRQADISNQGVVDAAMYSLLATEYYAN